MLHNHRKVNRASLLLTVTSTQPFFSVKYDDCRNLTNVESEDEGEVAVFVLFLCQAEKT